MAAVGSEVRPGEGEGVGYAGRGDQSPPGPQVIEQMAHDHKLRIERQAAQPAVELKKRLLGRGVTRGQGFEKGAGHHRHHPGRDAVPFAVGHAHRQETGVQAAEVAKVAVDLSGGLGEDR